MDIVTAAEMRTIDRRAIEEYGIPGIVLMENAGLRIVEIIRDHFPRGRVLVLAGRGNNGGDGLVVARHLCRERDVSVWLAAHPYAYQGDALTNLTILQRIGHPVRIMDGEASFQDLEKDLSDSALVVDALLGTGISREVDPLFSAVIRLINSKKAAVLSVDIPSGVCADSGRILGEAVRASLTVTFALPKRGLLLFPGAGVTGRLEVVDIGIPAQLLTGYRLRLLTAAAAYEMLPRRLPDGHKGTFGSVLLVAGSPGMTGAAVLAARAALRGGAGLVTVALPAGIQPVVAAQVPEALTLALPENKAGCLSQEAVHPLCEKWRVYDAVAIGPGLSQDNDAVPVLQSFLQECLLPVVMDADALNLLAKHPELLKDRSAETIITPHPGEAARLLNCSVQKVQEDRLQAAWSLAQCYSCTVVLKGAHTVIAGSDEIIFLNVTGNSGMATAGSGDVLTGLIASLLAQGLAAYEAARLAVYLHGLAGDLAAAKKGEAGLLAGDITEHLPQSYLEIQKIHI